MAEILIFEDVVSFRRLITAALRNDNHNVTGFGDGGISIDPQALATADLLITDIKMPNVDGIEAIKNAKMIAPNLKIIAISGSAEPLAICLQLGVSAVLEKPFEPDALIEMVRDVRAG